jgi:ubiquinone biosynthesis protein UbiJ
MSEVARVFFSQLLPSLVRSHPNLASYMGCCMQVTLEEQDGATDDWCLDFRQPERWSIEPRHAIRPDATIRMEASRFEHLLTRPIPEWADAYARGTVRIDGDLICVAGLKGFFDYLEPSRLARLALKVLGPAKALSLAARRVS